MFFIADLFALFFYVKNYMSFGSGLGLNPSINSNIGDDFLHSFNSFMI